LDDLLQYTKLMYECGDYVLCAELLKHYKTIVAVDAERPVNKDTISNLWGQLASNILVKDFKVAAELILEIYDKLEKAEKAESAQQKMPMREVLLQRTWWLHWALYAVFNSEEVDPKVLDFFITEKSLSIISLSCPYLFRYVGACLILNKRLKLVLFDTVKVLQHECGSYSDPITRFLLALYTDMDFDEAQRELQKCKLVCKGDYFLSAHWAEFEENARLLIFERYCRIHQCINIQMIAEKLNMAPEEAELWIVKLIQSAKLDARIDSEKSRVVMSKAPPSVYQQVIEKTKNLSFRSTMTLANLEKSANDRAEMRPGM
jgi:translation initiation factor 3 subunit E